MNSPEGVNQFGDRGCGDADYHRLVPDRLSTIDVVCFKWGDRYPSVYANRLRAMLLRHLDADIVFHCVTDDVTGLHPEIVTHDIAAVRIDGWDIGNGVRISAFSRDFLGLAGRDVLIIDLDVVVVGDMSYVLDRPEEAFIITPGTDVSTKTRCHGAVYRLRVGSHPYVWEDLIANQDDTVAACQKEDGTAGQLSEQRWLDHCFARMEFFPDGMVAHYRRACAEAPPTGRLRFLRHLLRAGRKRIDRLPPPGTRMVSFAGPVDPAHVAHSDYEGWLHAPWVAAHWRE